MKTVFPLPAFNDNYIWCIQDSEHKLFYVVDPGDGRVVMNYCKQHNTGLSGILITHHHADHTGGISTLANVKPLSVYGPENIHGVTHPVSDGIRLSLPVGDFDVIGVPGHTCDHLAYFSKTITKDPVLFIGDTLFSSGCGRLFEGTAEDMYHSLSRLKNELPDETLVFCAHEYTLSNLAFALKVEPDNLLMKKRLQQVQRLREENKPTVPTTLLLEKQVNPFLRTACSSVAESVSRQVGKSLLSEVEVFSALRQWKDNS